MVNIVKIWIDVPPLRNTGPIGLGDDDLLYWLSPEHIIQYKATVSLDQVKQWVHENFLEEYRRLGDGLW